MMAKFVITKPYTAKSRPILFKGEMVRAILDGRKTQTRRVINPRSKNDFIYEPENKYSYSIRDKNALWHSFQTMEKLVEKFCPHGNPGDFLWVRETWATHPFDNKIKPSLLPRDATVYYRADYLNTDKKHFNWRPSIFMPRWASRISLRIVDIKAERIQDISSLDIVKEGITPVWTGMARDFDQEKWGYLDLSAVSPEDEIGHYENLYENFIELWDSINAKRGYSWESNPWVWIISFKVLDEEMKE